ncbi:hypothetical protein [Comamonas serinivorans]|uniref:hypothetical protein n=1 Tax=Comamonas serinivorans TaxID=1082851 RepID=UPI0012F908B4|nr:hypothetical protein [Comamonas serinivorans]
MTRWRERVKHWIDWVCAVAINLHAAAYGLLALALLGLAFYSGIWILGLVAAVVALAGAFDVVSWPKRRAAPARETPPGRGPEG